MRLSAIHLRVSHWLAVGLLDILLGLLRLLLALLLLLLSLLLLSLLLLVPLLLLIVHILVLFILLLQSRHLSRGIGEHGPGRVETGLQILIEILTLAFHLRFECLETWDFSTRTLALEDAVTEGLLEVGLVCIELLRICCGGLREDDDVVHHLLDLGLQLRGLVGSSLLLRLLRLRRLLLLLLLWLRLLLRLLLRLRYWLLGCLLRVLLPLCSALRHLSALSRHGCPLRLLL